MTLLLNPKTRHLVPEQETDFCALVAEGPANTVTPAMSEDRLNVHGRPTLWAAPADVKLIGIDTVAPAVPEPDPAESKALCANADCVTNNASAPAASASRSRRRLVMEIMPCTVIV